MEIEGINTHPEEACFSVFMSPVNLCVKDGKWANRRGHSRTGACSVSCPWWGHHQDTPTTCPLSPPLWLCSLRPTASAAPSKHPYSLTANEERVFPASLSRTLEKHSGWPGLGCMPIPRLQLWPCHGEPLLAQLGQHAAPTPTWVCF